MPLNIILLVMLLIVNSVVNAQIFQALELAFNKEDDLQKQLLILNKSKTSLSNYSITDQASYYFMLGKVHQKTSKLNLALQSYNWGISLLLENKLPPSILLADLYLSRSTINNEINHNFKDSCIDREKSLSIERQLTNNHARLAETISNYAVCQYDTEHGIAPAITLFDEAIEISQSYELTNDQQATIYNRAGLLYNSASLYDMAYKNNKRAYILWKKDDNDLGILYMLTNMIHNCIDLGDFNLAQQHLDQMYQFILERSEFKDTLITYYYIAGKLAYTQKDWLLSIDFFTLAKEERKNSDEKSYIQASYELLSTAQFRAGLIEESFKTIDELNVHFPSQPAIKKEVVAIIEFKNENKVNALNTALNLWDVEKESKRNFIKQSISHTAHQSDNNLHQLDNFKLKQRFTYSIFLGLFFSLIIATYAYIQHQRRKLAAKEKQLSDNILIQKNQLLADVSHELGTPLTVLKLQVETLKDNLEDDVHASYNALDNKLNDMEHLIDDIQQLAQSDIGALTLNFDMLNINSNLNLWHPEFEHFSEENQLTFTYKNNLPDDLFMKLDRDKIKQVITNLLANSAKYTDKPGKIELDAFVENDTLSITINDSAPAVAKEELNNIFERLYRIENSRNRETGGSGLGLAICKSLVEAHNGEIYAEHSNLGGLKVIIKLPI
jgi:signal transduction histidine kinase